MPNSSLIRRMSGSWWIIVVGLTVLIHSSALAADDDADNSSLNRVVSPEEQSEFSRYIRVTSDDEDQPEALQTSVCRYIRGADADRVVVDLVAAVHIGERSYYEDLNELFDDYDVVLYELVAEQGTRPARGGHRSAHPISALQDLSRSVLALESQLEHVDYSRDHFVHADLSPAEISERMAERGDSAMTIAMDVFAHILRQIQRRASGDDQTLTELEQIDPLMLLLNANFDLRLKQALAKEMATGELMEGALPKSVQQMLIKDRNEAVVRVLLREIDKGHKKIAIFYGAAHMSDFERRLINDLGMTPGDQRWITAWDLSPRTSSRPDPFRLLLQYFDVE